MLCLYFGFGFNFGCLDPAKFAYSFNAIEYLKQKKQRHPLTTKTPEVSITPCVFEVDSPLTIAIYNSNGRKRK